MLNLASLNQRVNALASKINNFVPVPGPASSLVGGIASQIPFQSAPSVTGFIANGTSGQYLKSNGTATPSWATIPVIPATPTLAQVLTAGNTAGSSTINMNNNNITSILQASGQAVLLTNPTANTTLSVNSSSATTTTLLTKFNNGRTAQTGEAIRLDFNAKNSAGTEFNYGKIHMNTPAFGVGVERGRMDFDVKDQVGLTTYLNCNGNTLQVNSFRELNMNTNGINNIVNATTYQSSQLAPQKVDFLTANGSLVPSTLLDLNQRYICVNAGATQTWVNSGVPPFDGFSTENVTASCVFYSAWWVGTSGGNLYWSNDQGATWTFKYYFGGQINCLAVYNSGNNMAVGGNFGFGFSNLAGVDTGFSVFDITPSYNGVNGVVNCLFYNSANNCLMVGGNFTDFNGGSGGVYNTNALFTLESGSGTWYNALNYSGGGFIDSMFNVGNVYSICRDSVTGFIIVGGDFIQVQTSSGTQGTPYLFIFQTYNGYDPAGFYPYGASGFNAPVRAVLDNNGSGVLVGGDYTNLSPSMLSYGLVMVWDGVSQWNLNPYPLGGGGGNSISTITQPASGGSIYTLYQNQTLYIDNTLLPSLPAGTAWGCIAVGYPSPSQYYATNGQPAQGFPFYILNTATNITLTSVYPIKQYSTASYTNINLLGTGSIAELLWNVNLSEWYIISSYGTTFT